jgi:hypothetical protein
MTSFLGKITVREDWYSYISFVGWEERVVGRVNWKVTLEEEGEWGLGCFLNDGRGRLGKGWLEGRGVGRKF